MDRLLSSKLAMVRTCPAEAPRGAGECARAAGVDRAGKVGVPHVDLRWSVKFHTSRVRHHPRAQSSFSSEEDEPWVSGEKRRGQSPEIPTFEKSRIVTNFLSLSDLALPRPPPSCGCRTSTERSRGRQRPWRRHARCRARPTCTHTRSTIEITNRSCLPRFRSPLNHRVRCFVQSQERNR